MSKLLRNVALVPDDNIGGQLSMSVLAQVAAALQKQATRDFSPIWDVTATVDAFASLDDVPLGYWPILVGNEGQGGGGVHLDDNNQPFALVDFTPDWTITASHECLEMLADPFGNRLVAGDGPDPARPGRVEFLVEVCDPCETPSLGYTVNGIRVSDFYTPQYFDPAQPAEEPGAVRYDFRGHIKAPRQVLKGGYLSWREADGSWFQEKFFGAAPVFPPSIGRFDRNFGSLRSWIDYKSLPERATMMKEAPAMPRQVLAAMAARGQDNDMATQANKTHAARLRNEIKAARARK
jgi:hypothetical protein